jgi:hypothetical protein
MAEHTYKPGESVTVPVGVARAALMAATGLSSYDADGVLITTTTAYRAALGGNRAKRDAAVEAAKQAIAIRKARP